jgi:hypothetical protein
MGETEERQHDHAVVMANLRQVEVQLANLSRELGETRVHHEHEFRDLKEELARFYEWMQEDSKKSAWFYAAESDLRQVVESNRWIKTTQRIVIWAAGAIAGTIMAWNAAAVWIKENL